MTETKPSLVSFPAGTTDQEKADAYRNETRTLLEAFCGLRERAKRDGLVINVAVVWDQYGRSVVGDVSIVKPL